MFHNMISCSRTWNRVSKTCSMFKNMNHVLEHDFMFQNMISCSRTWFMFLNIEHVPKEHVFGTRFHVREHEIMFWNMKSCSKLVSISWTCYGHVMDMMSCSWTWNHVPEHEIMFQNMKSCSRTWNHVQIMFDSNRHVQDCACMFTACKSNHKSCNMETLRVQRGQKVFRGQHCLDRPLGQHCLDRSLVILRRCVVPQGPIQLWCYKASHCSCQILLPGHEKRFSRLG